LRAVSTRITVLVAAVTMAVASLVVAGVAWAQEANVFSEDWTGADGAAWDASKWSTNVGTSATADVLSNQGRMRFENVSGARALAIASMPKRADTEALMSFRFPSTDPKGFLQIFSRASGNWVSGYPGTGYFVDISNTGSNVGLRKVSAGTVTQLSDAPAGQSTTEKQWVRLRVEGSTLKVKVWTDGTPEPEGWEMEATDASFSEPGVLQLRWARASVSTAAREVYLDDLTVEDLGGNSSLPAIPSDLVATATSPSQIDLNWTDNATNETAYVLERSPDGETGWVELTSSLPANATSYSDTDLNPATTYHYRVKAANANGVSGYARTASATTHMSVPAAPTLSPTPDQTWMTNGKVYAIIRYGDYIYVGGQFTKARDMPLGKTFRATNLARFDADTGVADPSWTPDVTGADPTITRVNALVAAGGKIWVGGKFDAVDGIARRNLAAVSPQTGVVDPSIDPLVGSETSAGVRALLASNTKVYVGGGFGRIDGKGRNNLGALDLSGEVDQTWQPKTDSSVRSLAFSCDRATVFAGGSFRSAAGSDGVYSDRKTIARFDATSGALDPWAVPATSVGNGEVPSDFAVTCERITVPFLGPNIARSFRLDDGNTGTMAWEIKCSGDPQTVTMLGSDKLVMGGHFSQVAGERRIRIALINLSDGSPDPSWTPAVDGSWDGPWDLLVDENHLYVGGAFQTVAGLSQTYFARFTLV
jgi:hypothetical protein